MYVKALILLVSDLTRSSRARREFSAVFHSQELTYPAPNVRKDSTEADNINIINMNSLMIDLVVLFAIKYIFEKNRRVAFFDS